MAFEVDFFAKNLPQINCQPFQLWRTTCNQKPHGTKDQNQGLVRDVRALLRNCIFGITPERDGM